MRSISWSVEAIEDYHHTIDFILSKWPSEVAMKFIAQTESILSLIKDYPFLYPKTDYKHIRKAVINPHISLFYLVSEKEIVLIRFWNNHKDPNSLQIQT